MRRSHDTATPIVLAINSHLQSHAYGPFPTEQDAELWARVQNDDPTQTEYQYVVIAMLTAHVRVSPVRQLPARKP